MGNFAENLSADCFVLRSFSAQREGRKMWDVCNQCKQKGGEEATSPLIFQASISL